jgi:hypothetical protein
MSQENVELVKESLDAYARRDVEALGAFNDPEMVLDWSRSKGWLADVYRGFDEALRFYAATSKPFRRSPSSLSASSRSESTSSSRTLLISAGGMASRFRLERPSSSPSATASSSVSASIRRPPKHSKRWGWRSRPPRNGREAASLGAGLEGLSKWRVGAVGLESLGCVPEDWRSWRCPLALR